MYQILIFFLIINLIHSYYQYKIFHPMNYYHIPSIDFIVNMNMKHINPTTYQTITTVQNKK